MRIIDYQGKAVTNPDLEKGKLVQESQAVVFRYEITQHEQGHYETVAEYPNGGKDIKWVIDVPEEGRWVAYDEGGEEVETDLIVPDDAPREIDMPAVDTFSRYALYTAEELAERAQAKIQADIAVLKQKLADTDYISAKAMDSLIGCESIADFLSVLASFRSEYADKIAERKAWREEINELSK